VPPVEVASTPKPKLAKSSPKKKAKLKAKAEAAPGIAKPSKAPKTPDGKKKSKPAKAPKSLATADAPGASPAATISALFQAQKTVARPAKPENRKKKGK
jgi:hypothetical protein